VSGNLTRIEPCAVRWQPSNPRRHSWHACQNHDATHFGDHRCMCGATTPGLVPTPDGPLLPRSPEPLKGPRLRLAYACWRYGVWDDRAAEARAAFQASLDQGTGGDVWWERHLNIALGKRALWRNRIDRYSV
jgi:hypothetical protein